MNAVGITLLESDQLFIKIISGIINNSAEFKITDVFSYDHSFLKVLPELQTDLILIDITYPCHLITTLISETKKIRPDIKIVISSCWVQYDLIYQCINAGASGYINKSGNADYLLQTLTEITAGEAHISLSLARLLKNKLPEIKPEKLSDKENHILSLFSKGFSNHEVCKAMNENKRTILRTVHNIYHALA